MNDKWAPRGLSDAPEGWFLDDMKYHNKYIKYSMPRDQAGGLLCSRKRSGFLFTLAFLRPLAAKAGRSSVGAKGRFTTW